MSDIEKNKKIINNAISAYFMIFVSGFFLFNKDNKYLNNDFVKKHTQSALLIHLGFFLSYLIFIHLSLFGGIIFLGFSLHVLLASISCLGLLGVLMYGIFRAQKGEYFLIGEFINIFKIQKISSSQNESKMLEREKMNFIVAHIPFIGFINYASHSDKKYIQNATKINLLITVFFILLSGFGYINIANFMLLAYSIYLVFVGINIFITDNIFSLDLKFIPNPEKKYFITKALISYCRDYFGSKQLQNLSYYYEKNTNIAGEETKINYESIKNLPDVKGPQGLLYFPIVNFLFLFQKNKKQQFHIVNGSILSLIFILLYIFISLTNISGIFITFILIAFCYGYGFLQYNPVYKMPYIYMFYSVFKKLLVKAKDFNTKYNKQEEVHLSVKK